MDPIEKASEFLMGVLERMGIRADLEVVTADDHTTLEIQTAEPERIIGRHGKTIDALQHLVVKVVYRDRTTEKGKPIFIDAGGYRARHIERLESLAARTAERVKSTGGQVPMPPMSPADRRIVHMYLSNLGGLATQSEGEGESRHIVVSPA